MTVPFNIQGHVVDIFRDVAKAVNLPMYDLEFEDRGGVHFLIVVLKDGTRIPQELYAGWPGTLKTTLETLKREESRIKDIKETHITVAVIHKPTGQWTASDVQQAQVRQYADAIVAYFSKRTQSSPADFAVVEVNWSEKRLNITKLE